MECNLVDIRILIHCNMPFELQHYIMRRGSQHFPPACRDAVCSYPSCNCAICHYRNNCNYYSVFNQGLSTDPSRVKRHQKPALPFAFSFIHTENDPVNTLKCRLVVVWNTIPILEMLLQGFIAFIQSNDSPVLCTIIKITMADYHGLETLLGSQTNPVKQKESIILIEIDEIIDYQPFTKTELTLNLLTPLKLMSNNRIQHNFSFPCFIRSVMRRVSSLVYYYAGYEFDVDYKELSQRADKIICLNNNFKYNTNDEIYMAGIKGTGAFKGEFRELSYFLSIANYLNTSSKTASFGFGQISTLNLKPAID